MDRQPSAPGASAISEGSGNLSVLPFPSIASSLGADLHRRRWHSAKAGSMARATISARRILGRAPNASPGLLRPFRRPEYHIGPQRRDPIGAQPRQQAFAHAVTLVRAEGIDGGAVTR